jgi:hypothetical protein
VAATAPFSATNAAATRSISAVVVPEITRGSTCASVLAAREPAARIPAKSSGRWIGTRVSELKYRADIARNATRRRSSGPGLSDLHSRRDFDVGGGASRSFFAFSAACFRLRCFSSPMSRRPRATEGRGGV